MPTSQPLSKDGISKIRNRPNLKRVVAVTLLVASNVASYVVGNETVSLEDIVNLIVTTLAQGVLGG